MKRKKVRVLNLVLCVMIILSFILFSIYLPSRAQYGGYGTTTGGAATPPPTYCETCTDGGGFGGADEIGDLGGECTLSNNSADGAGNVLQVLEPFTPAHAQAAPGPSPMPSPMCYPPCISETVTGLSATCRGTNSCISGTYEQVVPGSGTRCKDSHECRKGKYCNTPQRQKPCRFCKEVTHPVTGKLIKVWFTGTTVGTVVSGCKCS